MAVRGTSEGWEEENEGEKEGEKREREREREGINILCGMGNATKDDKSNRHCKNIWLQILNKFNQSQTKKPPSFDEDGLSRSVVVSNIVFLVQGYKTKV